MEGSRKSILPLLCFKIQKRKRTKKKNRQMPAPYRIADVRETNATYHRTFEGKICNLVSNPRVTMAISQKKLALTTRPSCPLAFLKCVHYLLPNISPRLYPQVVITPPQHLPPQLYKHSSYYPMISSTPCYSMTFPPHVMALSSPTYTHSNSACHADGLSLPPRHPTDQTERAHYCQSHT